MCAVHVEELHSLSHTEREQLLKAVYPAEAHTLRLVKDVNLQDTSQGPTRRAGQNSTRAQGKWLTCPKVL